MKRFFCVAILAFTAITAFSQPNMACYLDTHMVEEQIFKKDTMWVVKPAFQQGQWNLYYDFNLSKIKAECYYGDDGRKVDIWKEYYKNGALKSEWDYKGPIVPAFPPGKELYPNGKMKIERTQTTDSLTEKRYFANGKMSTFRQWDKQGKLVMHREWCEEGQLIVQYNPTAAEPEAVKKYHCNGKLKAEYNWYAFGYTGRYKEYHSNGKVAVEGQFTEKPQGAAAFMARKDGVWTYYDEKGTVTKKETWENGKLVSK